MCQTVRCIDHLKAPRMKWMCQKCEGAEGELHKTTNYVILHPHGLLCNVHWNYGFLKTLNKKQHVSGIWIYSGTFRQNTIFLLLIWLSILLLLRGQCKDLWVFFFLFTSFFTDTISISTRRLLPYTYHQGVIISWLHNLDKKKEAANFTTKV